LRLAPVAGLPGPRFAGTPAADFGGGASVHWMFSLIEGHQLAEDILPDPDFGLPVEPALDTGQSGE
jgi:hypothetical protein